MARHDACINAGVAEYLVKSSQALASLEESLDRIFSQEITTKTAGPVEREPGLLFVFLSAKGGAGTSSLCANIAMNIKQAQPEVRTLVADLVKVANRLRVR